MKPGDKEAYRKACWEWATNSGGKDLGEFMFKAGIAHRESMFMAKIPSEDLLFNIAQRVIPAVEKAMAHRDAQPAVSQGEAVAIVDASDDGFFAEILPDRDVKVGDKLYAEAPAVAQEPVATQRRKVRDNCEQCGGFACDEDETAAKVALAAAKAERDAIAAAEAAKGGV